MHNSSQGNCTMTNEQHVGNLRSWAARARVAGNADREASCQSRIRDLEAACHPLGRPLGRAARASSVACRPQEKPRGPIEFNDSSPIWRSLRFHGFYAVPLCPCTMAPPVPLHDAHLRCCATAADL